MASRHPRSVPRFALVLAALAATILVSADSHAQCVVPDNGGGTVTLPPAGCPYLSPDEVHQIIDGLPAGTTLQLAAIHHDFICRAQAGAPSVCSFNPPIPGVDCDEPGGTLGGERECTSSLLSLQLTGTGMLAGYQRSLILPVEFETHVGPRNPGAPIQSFDTDMFRLQGQLPPGDPDFDLLRIRAGTDFGLPSPGHTTLTQVPGGNWSVDSFFDITYEIEFVGAPGSLFAGQAGTTTGTVHMTTSSCGDCDDGNPCTIDTCEVASGQCLHDPLPCDDADPCTNDVCGPSTRAAGDPCVVSDNGGGTVTLPPAGCDYLSPDEVHAIIDGLPAGTTIQFAAIHRDFICHPQDGTPSICSFTPPPGVDCEEPGGSLGGAQECAQSILELNVSGTGMLAGYSRVIGLPVEFETHVGPRLPGAPVQSFDTDMFRLEGQLPPGDPDFDLLRIRAGTDYGLPSPGHTTLTQAPGGNWSVDSFFDITYEIEFAGAPGGPFAGQGGTTTGTIHMATGDDPCTHAPACDDNNVCTLDACDPTTGQCSHDPVACSDGDPCTLDTCDPAMGCLHEPVVCDDNDPCTVDTCNIDTGLRTADPCIVADNGGGTVTLPPAGCDYLSPDEVHAIIDGLPAGTTLELAAIHRDFICHSPAGTPSICSFTPPQGVDCDEPGGSLGGEKECASSTLELELSGTGMLGGYQRTLMLPVEFETHVGPRVPGAPVQSFDTDMFRLQGQLPPGDPDFDLLRIRAGTDFGLPSPGHTTLLQAPGGNWSVDSFFDITYEIEFIGAPGGPFTGQAGTTTGTIRMATGTSTCTHTPVFCDDNDACTVDTCNTDLELRAAGDPCVVADNGGGTVTLPPAGCDYLSPDEVHAIIDGLPAGTTLQLAAIHEDFICREQAGTVSICSFTPPPGVDCEEPGGSLGGARECSSSTLSLELTGTGMLGGYQRALSLPVEFETHVGPRSPGAPVQSFDTDMFRLQGQLPPGDPDFDLLRVRAGTDYGLPSPGHTTLLQAPGGNWSVDSFFDITYEIEFIGAPGGPFAGQTGTTTGAIHMATGASTCSHTPVACDDNDACTFDACDPTTGECLHDPGPLPIEVGRIDFPTKSSLTWSPSPAATHWNSYRGSIAPGAWTYNHVCLESADANGDGPTQTTDSAIPPSGGAFYYLVSGETACGESSLGNASSGARPNASPCPTPP